MRGLHHGDLARFVLATWKLLRRVVQTNHLGTRSAGERREKERGARKRGRKKGGKRRERKTRGRERGEGTCTRARRTRLSGQFESIKPKVAAGLCSSTRSLLPETPFLFSSLDRPRHSWREPRQQTGNFHLAPAASS